MCPHQKSCPSPALITPSPPLTTPLSTKALPHKLAANELNEILKNPSFYSFASFLIVSLTPFICKPDPSRSLIIFMISFKSSFENTNAAMPYPKNFFWIAPFVAVTAVVNPKGTKTLLANVLKTFLIKSKPVFSNGARSLPRNPPNCIILDNWVFESFTLTDEPFGKALRIFKTFLLVNDSLCGKLVP